MKLMSWMRSWTREVMQVRGVTEVGAMIAGAGAGAGAEVGVMIAGVVAEVAAMIAGIGEEVAVQESRVGQGAGHAVGVQVADGTRFMRMNCC